MINQILFLLYTKFPTVPRPHYHDSNIKPTSKMPSTTPATSDKEVDQLDSMPVQALAPALDLPSTLQDSPADSLTSQPASSIGDLTKTVAEQNDEPEDSEALVKFTLFPELPPE
jgi:hypothetical protein